MVEFTLTYPPKLSRFGMNAIYSGKHWTKRKKDSDYWHLLVAEELRQQGIKRQTLNEPVAIIFYWDDRFDIDNHAYMGKMIVDALKGHIIKDDNRRYLTEVVHKFHEKGNIRVVVCEVSE